VNTESPFGSPCGGGVVTVSTVLFPAVGVGSTLFVAFASNVAGPLPAPAPVASAMYCTDSREPNARAGLSGGGM
jgi:hypothetical protein